MADRNFVIEVLLKARDETARAYASATGQMEAYDKLLDEQRAKTEATRLEHEKTAKQLDQNVHTTKRYKDALKELGLQIDGNNASHKTAVSKYVELEAAVNRLVKVQTNARSTAADLAKAEQDIRDAQLGLGKAISANTNLTHQQASARAQAARREAEYQARIEQTAKIEEQRLKERIASEREAARVVDELNREADKTRAQRQRKLEQENREEAQKTRARRAQDARDIAAQERALASATRPAQTLARTDINQTQEIRAERELAASRDRLVQAGLGVEQAERRIHNIREQALNDVGFASRAERDAAVISHAHAQAIDEVSSSQTRYERLIRNVAQAERDLEIAQRRSQTSKGLSTLQRQKIVETAEVNVAGARAHLEEFRLSEEAHRIHIPVHADTHPIERDLAAERQKMEATPVGGSGGGGFIDIIQGIQRGLGDLDTSTSGFSTHFRNAFGFAAVALLQPLLTIILGIVGAMGALASAAVAAGGALGGLFATAGAQGVPAFGLLAAAAQRLTQIFSYVSAAHQQLQQRFVAQFQAAQQNALGINQVAIAQHNYQQALQGVKQAQFGVTASEHSYSNALYAQRIAVRNVGIAQFQLNQTRQQATRQLQDLVLQERAARLAAEASSLAVTDAQKALRAAIATGGDVQGAQLQLQQSQLSHVQATVSAQRSIQDAARGSLARQGISQQVTQAQQAVVQARRAVTEANFSVVASANAVQQAKLAVTNAQYGAQQAKAAIALARQQAAGYNAATAAQLAWLRSQMTATERALAGNIQRIVGMFSGVSGKLRPMTDAILRPFIGITGRIIQIFNNRQFLGALQNLANEIGGAFGRIGKALLSNGAIHNFIGIINSAAANMRPLAQITISFFSGLGAIVRAAEPFVHNFLLWIQQAAGHFASWANSTRGQNWLKNFFDVGFRSLIAFLRLGGALLRLIGAVVTTGGGAKAGIGLLQSLTDWANRTTDSINHHGRAWRTLQTIWATIKPVMHALGEVLGAIGHMFLTLGASSQGKSALKNTADVIAHILIPALTKAFTWIGKVAGALLNFVHAHPGVAKVVGDMLALGVAVSIAGKAAGLIFGPISAVFGLLGKLAGVVKFLAGEEGFAAIGPALLAAFSNPVVLAVAAVAAALIGIAAATHNLGNLAKAFASPFIRLWEVFKPLFQQLGRAFGQLFGSLGIHSKNAHDIVRHFIDILGFLFRAVVLLNPVFQALVLAITAFTGAVKFVTNIIKTIKQVFTDVFRVVSDIVHGRFGKLPGDFFRIGKDIVKGLWNGIKIIGETVFNVFKNMVNAVLRFLGISSPSTLFAHIGHMIVQGLWNGIKSIVEFGAKIVGWIASGIGKVLSWAFGLGKNILKGILHGAQNVAHLIISIGSSIFDWVWDGIKTIASRLFNIGKGIIHAIVSGIKSVGHLIKDAVLSFVPKPARGVVSKVLGVGADIADPFGILHKEGGPIGLGYGGGDRIPIVAEEGEHMWTKEEVHAAGGHRAMYAMRSFFGGGGQGGPRKFDKGGAIPGVPVGVVGSGSGQSMDFQGVHGTLGGDLKNVQNFAKQFRDDWKAMWDAISKQTKKSVQDQEDKFQKLDDNITNTWNNLQKNLANIWNRIIRNASNAGSTLYKNVTGTLASLDKAVFNAFWYVQHAANASLKAFQAKPVNVDLSGIPKFSGGGPVGNYGERGGDEVVARVGRGEAILNWAHQKFVDPALRSFYGFGLDKLFQKVRGEHSGERPGGFRVGAKGLPSFAGGGYVSPFPKGTSIRWERQDAGLDMVVPPGTPVLAIGDGRITGIDPNWYAGQPLIEQSLANGPDAGKFVYYAEGITPHVHTNQPVKAGQVIAVTTSQPTGLEFGFGGGGTSTLRATVAGHGDSAGWWSSTFEQFMRALVAGHSIAVSGNFPMGAAGPMWKMVKEIAVKSHGPLSDLARKAIKKVTDAANAFGQKKAGQSGAPGSRPGTVPGPVVTASWFDDPSTASGRAHIPGFAELSNPPGAHNWSALGGLPMGELIDVSWGGRTITIPRVDVGAGGKALPGAAVRAIDLTREAAQMLPGFIQAGLVNVRWQDRHKKAFAKGGFAGTAGERLPIAAHAGEWILNKMQQMKLASKAGMTVERLKDWMGFSGGPLSYAGGGEVGSQAGGVDRGSAKIVVAINEFATYMKKHHQQAANKDRQKDNNKGSRSLFRNPTDVATLGDVTAEGAYTAPTLPTEDPLTLFKALDRYNKAQQIVLKMGRNGKKLKASLDTFLKNLNVVGGDNGLFALAAQAVADFATDLQTNISLLSSGVTRIGHLLSFGQPAQPIKIAYAALQAAGQLVNTLRALQTREQRTYRDIQTEIARVRAEPQTAETRKRLQQLLGARADMIKKLRDVDGQLATALQDQYDKATELFQAQTDQALRGYATLTGRQLGSVLLHLNPQQLNASFSNLAAVIKQVGPQIGQGIAQMAQAIAQSLGDPAKIAQADQLILSTAQSTQEILFKRYQEAAAKAQKDPRWAKVADDLLTQLEAATEAVVQAQVQALQDAIGAQDVRGQQQQQAVDFWNRILAVQAGMGNQQQAAAGQIDVSRANTAGLQSQLAQYQELLQKAQSIGDVQAVNDLTSKIIDLTAQIAEANLQTQQLIVAQHQLAVTMLTTARESTSSFFGAANSIAQTLGAIMGNQNLPALINYAKEAGAALLAQVGDIVNLIDKTINDPNKPFAQFQPYVNVFLNELKAAFEQGPQAFADELAKLAPQLGALMAGMTQEEQTLFQGLIQAMIDNTTAQVDNTKQLQDLNATSNQQQFTSSAWTMFRQAIFNGLGGLLPQYAMAVPSLDVGGTIGRSGLLLGHRGEEILPATVTRSRRDSNNGSGKAFRDINITNPTEVADPIYLGNEIAWRLDHNPNSR